MGELAPVQGDRLCFARHCKSLQACVVLVALVAVLAGACPRTFAALVNPCGLSATSLALLFVLKCVLLALLDKLVASLVYGHARPLPFRAAHPNVKGLVMLEWIDYMYLAINSWVEFVFAMQLCCFVAGAAPAPGIAWRIADVGWLNTAPALWLLFAVDDALYAPCHRLMHWKLFYPYVHKHHHRQTLPRRGYLDAGNEHPAEQLIGLGALWLTLHIVARTAGLHVGTIVVHFLCYATLAVLNHTDRDVHFGLLGFDYSVGTHEMHHRHPNCNMAVVHCYILKFIFNLILRRESPGRSLLRIALCASTGHSTSWPGTSSWARIGRTLTGAKGTARHCQAIYRSWMTVG